jgi:hypothetical protein
MNYELKGFTEIQRRAGMHVRNLFVLVALLSLGFSNPSSAQFMDALKKTGPGDAASPDAASAQQDSFTTSFRDAYVKMLTAQGILLEAFGQKEDAAALKAEAESLQSGPIDKDAIKKVKSSSSRAAATVNEKMESEVALDASSKETFAEAIPVLVQGTLLTAQLPAEAKTFSDSAQNALTSASLMGKAKLTNKFKTGTYLATQVPDLLATSGDNYKKVLTFANKQEISVPEDATSLLGTL